MTKEQFDKLLEEIMEKIEDGPGSHIDMLAQIAKRHTALKELHKTITAFSESIGAMRLTMKYLVFDLEATRRERDELRMQLEDQE